MNRGVYHVVADIASCKLTVATVDMNTVITGTGVKIVDLIYFASATYASLFCISLCICT